MTPATAGSRVLPWSHIYTCFLWGSEQLPCRGHLGLFCFRFGNTVGAVSTNTVLHLLVFCSP